MQIHKFHNGGAVVHKVTGSFVGWCSCWFDQHNNLVDAEQIFPDRSVRTIRRKAPIWNYLQQIGRTIL